MYPRDVLGFCLQTWGDTEVIEWEFIDTDHPLLFRFEATAQVFLKQPLGGTELLRFLALVREAAPFTVEVEDIVKLLSPVVWADNAQRATPCSLGHFPRSLLAFVSMALAQLGSNYTVMGEPEPRDLPVLFLIDGVDYIVAQDFDIDVPVFEHDEAWFAP